MADQLIKYRVCDKCEKETVAAMTHKLMLDGDRYELDLCEKHGKQLHDAIDQWALLGTHVGTPTVFDKARPVGNLSNLPARVNVPQPASEPVPAHRGPMVADYADAWEIVPHARERMLERDVTLAEVLRCAQYPESKLPSAKYEGYYELYRGDVGVVVHGHKIITVLPRQDERIASGSEN